MHQCLNIVESKDDDDAGGGGGDDHDHHANDDETCTRSQTCSSASMKAPSSTVIDRHTIATPN